jgi:hypothetical protein
MARRNLLANQAGMLGFAAFEAHVNAIADDFLTREDLNPHERGLLAEHAVELVDGEFQEKASLRIQRLEDRLLFLCRRFSKTPIDLTASPWGEFIEATDLRNKLTHPKAEPPGDSRCSAGSSSAARARCSAAVPRATAMPYSSKSPRM